MRWPWYIWFNTQCKYNIFSLWLHGRWSLWMVWPCLHLQFFCHCAFAEVDTISCLPTNSTLFAVIIIRESVNFSFYTQWINLQQRPCPRNQCPLNYHRNFAQFMHQIWIWFPKHEHRPRLLLTPSSCQRIEKKITFNMAKKRRGKWGNRNYF